MGILKWHKRFSNRAMQRTRARLAVFVVLVFATSLFPSLPPSAAQLGAPSRIVERWEGTIRNYEATDWHARGGSAGVEYMAWTSHIKLQVDETGLMRGTVEQTLELRAYKQDPGFCYFNWPGYHDCWLIYSIIQPHGAMEVEGRRYLDSNNQPVFDITYVTETRTFLSRVDESVVLDDYIKGPVRYTGGWDTPHHQPHPGYHWVIEQFDDGRPPIARHVYEPYLKGRDRDTETGYLVGTTVEPTLDLKPELAESNVYLEGVPVDDRFEARANWNTADAAGWLTWKLGQQPEEQTSVTRNTLFSKAYGLGSLSPGTTPLVVQAHTPLGGGSRPSTVNLQVAPPPGWAQLFPGVTAEKVDRTVRYRWNQEFPTTPLGVSVPIPDTIPFFGGKPFRIVTLQVPVTATVMSSGSGTVEGADKGGFEVLGGFWSFPASVRGDLELQPSGLTLRNGLLDFTLSHTFERSESLLTVIPPVKSVIDAVREFSGLLANWLQNIATLKLEFTPRLTTGLGIEDKGDTLDFALQELAPGANFQAVLNISLWDKVMQVLARLAGDAHIAFTVPGPEFKEAVAKFIADAEVYFFQFVWKAEKSWEWRTGAGMASQSVSPVSGGQAGRWTLMDRSYLEDPDYARWTASGPSQYRAAAASGQPVDEELVENVFPHARPSLAASPSYRLLVWSHDKPGSLALSGQELAYSWADASGVWHPWQQVTDDDLADWTPRATFVNDETALAVWQRFDSSTPGDPNTDPGGYVSHLQVAAARWSAASNTWSAPQQLSQSGSVNARPQVGALGDGALAVWVNNPSNQIMGDVAHPDAIQFARYTLSTNDWTTATTLIGDVTGLLDMSLGTNGDHAALVYALDADGILTTTNDIDLYYTLWLSGSWSAPVRLTDNGVVDDEPQLVLDESGNPLLVWRQGEALKFLANSWSGAAVDLPLADSDAAFVGADLSLTGGAEGKLGLTWQEAHNDGTYLGYAVYDPASGSWSDARTYSPTLPVTYASGASPLMVNTSAALVPAEGSDPTAKADMLVGYQLAPVTPITVTLGGITVTNYPTVGAHGLHVVDLPLGVNLSIADSDLAVTPVDAGPGDPITLAAAVHNVGELRSDAVTVTLKAWNPLHTETPLSLLESQTLGTVRAGEAVTLTFAITNPTRGDRVLSVCVDGDPTQAGCVSNHTLHETNEQDNMATVSSALSVQALPTAYRADGVIVSAVVKRSTPIYSNMHLTASLRLDRPDGPAIDTVDVYFPISPTAELTATTVISLGRIGSGEHLIYWNIDPNNVRGGMDRLGNVTSVGVRILPDLSTTAHLVGFGRKPGSTAPFSIRVENVGNWPSQGGRLIVYDASPYEPGAHELLSKALPDIDAGEGVELAGTLNLAGTPAATSGLQAIWVELDADDSIAELSENNNLILVSGTESTFFGPDNYRIYLPLVIRNTGQ